MSFYDISNYVELIAELDTFLVCSSRNKQSK